MGRHLTSIVVAILVLSLSLEVNCQWCTGSGSTTQSKTAADDTVDYISSRYYPYSYSNNLDCVSTISTSGSNQVLFYVQTEYIERNYDYLKIYSGSAALLSSLKYHSDNYAPPYVDFSSGTTLRVDFYSDYSITYGGFRMYYIAVDRVNLPSCSSSLSATTTYQQLSYVSSSSQSSACTWTISPTTTGGTHGVEVKVLLVQGQVGITESGSTTNYYTADSVYVGQASSNVQVSGSYGNDFVVQYKEVVVSSATSNVISTSPTTDNSICTNSFRTSYDSTIQYVESPNYPGHYPDFQYCALTISADNSSQSVFVNMTDYAFVTGDSLSIYDGSSTVYNQFSGVDLGSNYTSSGSTLYLLFETNSFGQNRGFQLSYQSVTREVPYCDQSYVLDANVTATSSEQTILSPNYPSLYDNSIDKYWLIVKPSESDNIVLDFRAFSVEEATGCIYDYVSIFDGACKSDPLIATVCGHNPVTFEDSSGVYILIQFYTDGSVTNTGWKLTYYIGTYQDPEVSASTAESKGLKDYIYPIIAISVLFVITVAVFIYLYFKGKGRVSDGRAQPSLKKRTTHDLLTELTNRYGSAETDKKQKIKRKGHKYHPEPNPPGPNVNVIQLGANSPHPPPGLTDPAHPPDFLGTGSEKPTDNLAPVLTDQTNLTPTAPVPDASVPSSIPPPFKYLTPAEARAAGVHG